MCELCCGLFRFGFCGAAFRLSCGFRFLRVQGFVGEVAVDLARFKCHALELCQLGYRDKRIALCLKLINR